MHGHDQPLLRQFLHQLVEALPFFGAEQARCRQLHVLEEQFGGVGGIHAELLELAAAPEALRIVGLDHEQRDALGAGLRIGLGDDDDQIGVLAVGDEGLGAVEHVAVAGFLRRRAHALQIGAGAGLGHGDGADHLAGRELRQPALLLIFGAVVKNVGRDDPGMQRRAEGIETGERKFAIDHRLMREASARAAIFLRHRCAEQAGRAGLGPDIAIVHAGFVPAVEMGNELVGDEAPRLLFEQDKVFAHPGRAREIECVHGRIRF